MDKGCRPLPPVTSAVISADRPCDGWDGVRREFRDDVGDPARRNFKGYGVGTHYANDTGRNDVVAAKVSRDATGVWFLVRTRAPLTKPVGDDWMTLYLNTDGDYATGWLGYDLAVRDDRLQRSVGGDRWADAGPVQRWIDGDRMVVRVPLAAVDTADHVDFKWADHCHDLGDWSDFYLNGDAAPNGRFNYRAAWGR